MTKFYIPALFLALSGCATTPQQAPLPADYGSPIEVDAAISQAKELMNGQLKDPYSAMWQCSSALYRGMLGSGRLWGEGSEDWYGWLLDCDINAKNSYGAYIGTQQYRFLFHNGYIIRAAQVNLGMGATRVIYSR